MPLETKHTIHIFWSPWKISANTFITAERENMHRRGEDLLWVFGFCFSKKISLPLPNGESYIVLICLQINQLTWIPVHLTHLLPVKALLSPHLVFYICQDHRLSFSIVAWNSFHFPPPSLKVVLKIFEFLFPITLFLNPILKNPLLFRKGLFLIRLGCSALFLSSAKFSPLWRDTISPSRN